MKRDLIDFVVLHLAAVALVIGLGGFAEGQTTVPTAVPAGIITDVGTAAAVRTIYHAGQAPAVAWFDGRGVGPVRTAVHHWNFGDHADNRVDWRHVLDPVKFPAPTVDANSCLTGPIVAHLYLWPGSYHVVDTVVVAGVSRTYELTVIVDAETRRRLYFDPRGDDAGDGSAAHPWATAVRYAQTCELSGVHVIASADWRSGKLPRSIELHENTVVEGGILTTPDGYKPGVGDACFHGWNGRTSHALVYNLTASAPSTPAKTAGGYPYNTTAQGAELAQVRGDGVAVIDCRYGDLFRVVEVAPDGGDGTLVQGLRPLTTSTSVVSQVVSGWGRGTRTTVAFCDAPDSITECCIRFDGVGNNRGLDLEFNHVAWRIDPARGRPTAAKAPLVVRAATDWSVINNSDEDGELSAIVTKDDLPRTPTLSIDNGVIRGNVLRSPHTGLGAGLGAFLHVSYGVHGCTVSGNDVVTGNVAGCNVTPYWSAGVTLSDVDIGGNVFSGSLPRFVGVTVNQPLGIAVPATGSGWPTVTIGSNTVNGK